MAPMLLGLLFDLSDTGEYHRLFNRVSFSDIRHINGTTALCFLQFLRHAVMNANYTYNAAGYNFE